MKIEHVKIGSKVRVNELTSVHYLKYGLIKSLPIDDINGFIKVIIDDSGFHDNFTNECWFNPSNLSLINP